MVRGWQLISGASVFDVDSLCVGVDVGSFGIVQGNIVVGTVFGISLVYLVGDQGGISGSSIVGIASVPGSSVDCFGDIWADSLVPSVFVGRGGSIGWGSVGR